VAILRDLALALAYAHDQGVVHRDVKPANVMLDEQDRPHLIDFGLARRPEAEEAAVLWSVQASISANKTRQGDIFGTPAYMAPEMARGDGHLAGAALDQYSLGVVLYRLLTGRLPFRGSLEKVLLDIIHTTPPAPLEVRPDIPEDLDLICHKAMAKRPEDRYSSCRELADDLEHWLEGQPVSLRRPGSLERLGRFVRQERKLSAALGLTGLSLLALVIVLAVASFRLDVRARAEAQAHAAAEDARQNAEEARKEAQEKTKEAERASRKEVFFRTVAEKETENARNRLREKEVAFRKMKTAEELARKSGERLADTLNQSQRDLYFSLVHRAAAELHSGQRARARKLLLDCPKELCGWEWRYLTAATSRSPNGQANPADIALSPDGRWIAWCNTRGEVILRETTHPDRPQKPLKLRPWATRLAFSSNGGLLAVGYRGGEVCLFTVKTDPGDPIELSLPLAARTGPIDALVFSREGRKGLESDHLAVAVGKSVLVYKKTNDWKTSKVRYPLSLSAPVRRLGFTQDPEEGKPVLITATRNSVLSLRDLEKKENPPTFRQFTAGAVHPAGLFKAAAKEGGRIVVVNLKGREVCQFTEHEDDVEQINFGLTDETRVRVASLDRANFLRVWEVRVDQGVAAPQISELLHAVTAGAAAYSLNGEKVAWTSPDGTVRLGYPGRTLTVVYDLDGGGKVETRNQAPDLLARYAQYVHSVAYSPDGKYLVTGSSVPRAGEKGKIEELEGGEVVVWPLGEKARALVPFDPMKEPVWAVACGKNGVIAWGGRGEGISLWNVEGQDRASLKGPKGTNALAFSPNGRFLLSGGMDGWVKIHDVTKREEETLIDSGGEINAVAWSADGQSLAAARDDGQISVWRRADKGWDKMPRKMGHGARAHAVAFSPNGRHLATGGEDGLIRLWNVATGKEEEVGSPLRGHGAAVLALAFRAPRGERLASISRDRTVRLWELPTGREALVLPIGAAARPALAFSPHGGEELTAGTVHGVLRWRAESAPEKKARPGEE
jgi:WD40 repeat protein